MNQPDIAKIAKQHAMYRAEALAKRRNLAHFLTYPTVEESLLGTAKTLNEATMMLIRTEAKMRAIEELAEALGIAEQVAVLAGEGDAG